MKNLCTVLVYLALTFNFSIIGEQLLAKPGVTDTSFNPTDIGYGNGDGAYNDVYTNSIQSDGKIIIGGVFSSYNGKGRNRIARIMGGNLSYVVTESYDVSDKINVYPNPSEGIIIVALNKQNNTKAGLFVFSFSGTKKIILK